MHCLSQRMIFVGVALLSELMNRNRFVPLRKSPMHEWHVEHGAEFYELAGWERTQWFNSNAGLVEKYCVNTRPNEWDARWWSPIINAEHLAMREHAGIFDLSAFAIFDVQGAGALAALQHAVLAQMDVPVGRVVYTPVLSPGGGFKSDLTIMRLGDDLFRRCIKTYIERHQFGTVVTEDLNAVIEELSGRSFDRFFDQWVYHAGQPALVAMTLVYDETPAHMGSGVVPLVQAGARIVGGCCGSTPEHIREFRRALDAYLQRTETGT